MALETHNYLNHLCESVARLMNGIVSERSIPLLRQPPQVVLTAPYPGSTDFHLCMVGRELLEDDKGSFRCSVLPDGFLVFRSPVRMRTSFSLVGTSVNHGWALKAYDRLTTYFFDNRSVGPFLPESFAKYPDLYDRMKGHRGEIRVRQQTAETVSNNGFSFGFDYIALYHSGNPLREEQRTKTRIIEMNSNDAHERSVL